MYSKRPDSTAGPDYFIRTLSPVSCSTADCWREARQTGIEGLRARIDGVEIGQFNRF
jgi:hypothetical protein